MRTVALALALALLPSGASANPLDWIKRHRRFLTMEAANAGALAVAQVGIRHCRRGDVEHCFEGYGAATQGFVMDATLSLVVLPAIAEMSWREHWGSFGYAVGYGAAPVNVALGIQQWRAYTPEVTSAHEAAKRYQPARK